MESCRLAPLTDQNGKLAIFIKSLKGGGAERSTVNLANALAASGVDVDLLVVDEKGVFHDLVSDKVNLIRLRQASFVQTMRSLWRYPMDLLYLLRLIVIPSSPKPAPAVPALADYLRKTRPRALLTALDYGNIAAVVARTVSDVDTRIVIGQRNQLSEGYIGRAKWRQKHVAPTLRYFFERADAIVSVSKGVSKDLGEALKLPDHQLHAVYNAVYNSTLEKQSLEDMQHVWFNNKEIPVIIAVGKLKPQKDFETLIKAFAKVRTKIKARLIILGEGPMLSDLNLLVEKLNISDYVIFEGFVQNPFKYMRNADLFVLSSKYEGLPGVLVQALACGCPVVSTDCPSGPREILENGKYGPLVPVADADALATAIIAQLQTRHDRDYLQIRGRSFSEEEAVRGYLRVLLGN